MKLITTVEYVDALDREITNLRKRVNESINFITRSADHMISGSNIAKTELPTMEEFRHAIRLHQQIEFPSRK